MFKELLAKLGQGLNDRNIPYMIIGGQAVILYGEPRLTRDIDITLGIGKEGLPEILSLCTALSLKPIPDNIDAFIEKTMVLPTIDEAKGVRVDFIFSFTPYERGAIGRSKKILLNDISVNFAAPEDVIIHKIFAHRPRDLEDARMILLKNPDIDLGYITRWLSEFDASNPDEALLDLWEKLLKETRKVDH
jgi:hypothetical protein